MNVTLLGGGFGRRLEVDFVAQAAHIARNLPGQPVQTLWTREQDQTHDFYRPPCVARYQAGFDAQGQLVAWLAASAGPSIVQQFLNRQFGLAGAGPDKYTAEGAFDQPYEWPAARVSHRIVDLPVPVGFWRSVGHSHQAFFKEGFIDEAAHATQQDPLGFRLALLKHHPRHAAVLQRAAEGRHGRVVLTGPAGIGITRLLDELSDRLRGLPEVVVARGAALESCAGEVAAADHDAHRIHRAAEPPVGRVDLGDLGGLRPQDLCHERERDHRSHAAGAPVSFTRVTSSAAIARLTPPAITAAMRLLSKTLFITQPNPSAATISGITMKKLKMPM
jgi:CO/xanthine dehydrogenase Mo-binding subunit